MQPHPSPQREPAMPHPRDLRFLQLLGTGGPWAAAARLPRPSSVPTEWQKQVPWGKASASPRELPEREKVFPFLAGVREVGGELAGGHGHPGAGRPQGFRRPAWGSLGVGGSDPLALPSPQRYL